MQITNNYDHLRNLKHGHVLIEPLGLGAGNVEEQLAAGAVVHDETDELAGHEAVVQCHYKLVPHLLQQPPLVARAVDLLHLLDGLLLERLERQQFVGLLVDDKVHAGLRPLAQFFNYFEVLHGHMLRDYLLLAHNVCR